PCRTGNRRGSWIWTRASLPPDGCLLPVREGSGSVRAVAWHRPDPAGAHDRSVCDEPRTNHPLTSSRYVHDQSDAGVTPPATTRRRGAPGTARRATRRTLCACGRRLMTTASAVTTSASRKGVAQEREPA